MNIALDPMAPLPDIIEPRWTMGSTVLSADTFTLDCTDLSLSTADLSVDGELAARMNAMFDKVGLIHLVNTGLTDLEQMRKVANLVVKKQMVYTGGANPRGALQANVYDVGAPLAAWLHYHHEMAYVGTSTTMLAFLCHKSIEGRGYTFVSENVGATDAILATDFGQKLKELGICYHRNLTDREAYAHVEEVGVYNHWQRSMLTEDPEEAARIAQSRGLEIEWGPNRLLKTRYYTSAFEYFPDLDRNLLFSSVADDGMWFDTWPMVQHLPYDERPLKLTFGDGSEMSQAEKKQFVDVYDQFGMPIEWRTGDIAVVCNYRFAHGRPSVYLDEGEERELGVLIGEAFDRVETLEDKW